MIVTGDLGSRVNGAGFAAWSGRLDRLLVLTLVVGFASTVLVVLPGFHGHAIVPAIDLVIDTVALVACATLTALAWARFRESRVIAAAYHAGAFLALTAAYAVAVVVSLQRSESIGGLAEPEDTQVLVFAVAQLAAAVLFVLAGVFTGRRTYGWRPSIVLVIPALAVLAAEVAGRLFYPPPDPLQIVVLGDSGLPHVTTFGAVLHVATASLFFVGALASRALWRTNRAVIDGWIAVGLVFAGFAELHWTLYPSAHPGQVSTGDLFRLACSVTFLYGLEKAMRTDLRNLRAANTELAELRDAEVEHASLEERARLARELHDGLAQDLWLAKLRVGELARMDGIPVEVGHGIDDVAAVIDIGIGEARHAVAALRNAPNADSSFCDLVRRTVEDYGDRFGLRVEFAFEGDPTIPISTRTQAEILRIIQEAVANVARHAEATIVGVRLAIRGDRITLRVVDNGRGFDAAAVGEESFGLLSMRERATMIGGRLRVASRVGTGTRVILSAPFSRPATTDGTF